MNDKPLTQHILPHRDPLRLAEYTRVGGYESVRKALQLSRDAIVEMVKAANLRGRGGAGFPTGMKWSFMPPPQDPPHPHYLVVNADEMEPGSFKDRYLLEGHPHQMVEAVVVSSYAVGATEAYIFLRWAYRTAARRLQHAIEEARAAGYVGRDIFGSGFDLDIHIHISAGRYMCGEETGLLNALEGKRATPRAKPPYPQQSGLWGKPTVVQNVETLCCVPHIINHGPKWFRGLSLSVDGGTKLYGVSGKVNAPGLWELPMGTSLREIIEERARGMRPGLTWRGVIPGGGSTPFLLPEHADLPLDFTAPQRHQSRLGTGTMIVLDDTCCPVGFIQNLETFFAQESCGWCTPCREGLPWTAKLLAAIDRGEGTSRDLETLKMHCQFLGPGRTFCALAPGAVAPLETGLEYFREDFERHVRLRGCPWHASA